MKEQREPDFILTLDRFPAPSESPTTVPVTPVEAVNARPWFDQMELVAPPTAAYDPKTRQWEFTFNLKAKPIPVLES